MSTKVGSIDNKTYYAETAFLGWNLRGLQIEVSWYPGSDDLVWVRDLGKVKSHDHAVDLVAATLKRQRELNALLTEQREIHAPQLSESNEGERA